MKKRVAENRGGRAQLTCKLSREQIAQEVRRVKAELAHDLKEHALVFPNPTEKTLSRVMTE